ncbi:MAG TPA: toll/interleukin-1 receptor domain-containing protein [Pirellulaceae bacterium]|jgi:nucleoside 2-deoxyribosyltransferase|nr:toll/interleukin-1 receptor domain-containing protein [Pirellulaceae bacterium]
MATRRPTYNVFVTYERSDVSTARAVAERLTSYGLSVFLDAQTLGAGAEFEDALWEAMWESEAVVAVVPRESRSSRMSFELGAAFAWKKPVYAVVGDAGPATIPVSLQHTVVLPLSRIDEVAQSVLRRPEPVSEADKKVLAEIYLQEGVPVDQLAVNPPRLDDVVKRFADATGRQVAGEEVMRLLLTMRKRKALPSLKQRSQKE